MQADSIVLGAGMVGVSVALHLQMRGRATVLVDRRGAGEETSYGNAGLIQREGVYPYEFPQSLTTLLRIAGNRAIDAVYHLTALPRIAPFMAKYWASSRPESHRKIAKVYAPLIENSVSEHLALAEAAGATDLIRRKGWLKAFRSRMALDIEHAVAETVRREFGVNFDVLDKAALGRAEPFLSDELIGAVHFTDPATVSDPGALVVSYFELFERLGGSFSIGDATSLPAQGSGWRVQTESGPAEAAEAVVALGPWADLVTAPLGYRLPLAVKRGYHMHYGLTGNAVLNHPTLDAERGYFLAPMRRGVRLTTGAEFADRDAPKTPVQLARAEPIARKVLPLGERLDPEPWMGRRPITPDMLPIIGPAPRHNGLWFAFGHAHHGLTLGPVTGRVVSEMMTGDKPLLDPTPYAPTRFASA